MIAIIKTTYFLIDLFIHNWSTRDLISFFTAITSYNFVEFKVIAGEVPPAFLTLIPGSESFFSNPIVVSAIVTLLVRAGNILLDRWDKKRKDKTNNR